MSKWLKLAASKDSTSFAGCQLTSVNAHFKGGTIDLAYCQSSSFAYALDENGKMHEIADWQAESLEELELQAMLHGCLFGLDADGEAFAKDICESMLARQLKAVEKDKDALTVENAKLNSRCMAYEDQLSDMSEDIAYAYDKFRQDSKRLAAEDLCESAARHLQDIVDRWQLDKNDAVVTDMLHRVYKPRPYSPPTVIASSSG